MVKMAKRGRRSALTKIVPCLLVLQGAVLLANRARPFAPGAGLESLPSEPAVAVSYDDGLACARRALSSSAIDALDALGVEKLLDACVADDEPATGYDVEEFGSRHRLLAETADTCADAGHRRRLSVDSVDNGLIGALKRRLGGDDAGDAVEDECSCRRRLAGGASTEEVCAADDAAHRFRRRLAGGAVESACAAAAGAHRRRLGSDYADGGDEDAAYYAGGADDAAADACGCCSEEKISAQAYKHREQASLEAIFVVIVIVAFTFEHAREVIFHHISEEMNVAVNAMFAEMTVLGFVGLCLFFVESSGAMSDLGAELFGVSHASHLVHIFHSLHMGVSVIVLAFMAFICYIFFYLQQLRKSQLFGEMLVPQFSELMAHFVAARKNDNKKEMRALNEHVSYLAMRQRFINRAGLPQIMDFAFYLRLSSANFINQLVEIDPQTWIMVWVMHVPLSLMWIITGEDTSVEFMVASLAMLLGTCLGLWYLGHRLGTALDDLSPSKITTPDGEEVSIRVKQSCLFQILQNLPGAQYFNSTDSAEVAEYLGLITRIDVFRGTNERPGSPRSPATPGGSSASSKAVYTVHEPSTVHWDVENSTDHSKVPWYMHPEASEHVATATRVAALSLIMHGFFNVILFWKFSNRKQMFGLTGAAKDSLELTLILICVGLYSWALNYMMWNIIPRSVLVFNIEQNLKLHTCTAATLHTKKIRALRALHLIGLMYQHAVTHGSVVKIQSIVRGSMERQRSNTDYAPNAVAPKERRKSVMKRALSGMLNGIGQSLTFSGSPDSVDVDLEHLFCSNSWKRAMHATFDIFDEDQSNSLDIKEVQDKFTELGLGQVNIRTVLKSMHVVSGKAGGAGEELKFEEFCAWLISNGYSNKSNYRNVALAMRSMLKADADGEMSVDSLSEFLAILDKSLSKHDVFEIYRKMDSDGSGSISVDELSHVLMGEATLADTTMHMAQESGVASVAIKKMREGRAKLEQASDFAVAGVGAVAGAGLAGVKGGVALGVGAAGAVAGAGVGVVKGGAGVLGLGAKRNSNSSLASPPAPSGNKVAPAPSNETQPAEEVAFGS